MKTQSLKLQKLKHQIKSNFKYLEKHDSIKIFWRDTLSCDNAWKTEPEIFDELEDNIMVSMGQLLSLDKDNIYIYRSINTSPGRGSHFDGGLRIPTGCIVEINKLK